MLLKSIKIYYKFIKFCVNNVVFIHNYISYLKVNIYLQKIYTLNEF